MTNRVFGDVIFNMGWESKSEISLFGRAFSIVVNAEAYYKTESITPQQEQAYTHYLEIRADISRQIEATIQKLTNNMDATSCRFVPQMLLIRRNGEYALLFDDKNDNENGIAVCIEPEYRLMTQDEFL